MRPEPEKGAAAPGCGTILLFDDYNGHTPVWYYLPLLTIMLPFLSFVWTWIRLKSGSLWPGVILHASHNTLIQAFFDPITVDNHKTRYVAGEFGAAILVLSILMAVSVFNAHFEMTWCPEMSGASILGLYIYTKTSVY